MTHHIVHVVPRLDFGGAERLLINLVPRLETRGFHQTIVTLDDCGGLLDNVQDLIDEKCAVHVIKVELKKPWTLVRAICALHKIITRQEADVVQGWLFIGNIVASLAALGTRCQVIWSVHAAGFKISDFKVPTRIAILFSLLVAKFSPRLIIYCTEQSRVDLEAAGFPTEKGTVIENGVPTDEIARARDFRAEARHQLGLADNKFTVACVARFSAQKDLPNLLRGVALLPQEQRPALLMIGTGMSRTNAAFMEAVVASGLDEDRCELHAIGPQSDPHRWLAAADLMVLPSAFGEALPLVVLEALALGIPVVATEVGGVARLANTLEVPAGVKLIPPRSPSALAEALKSAASASSQISPAQSQFWSDQVRKYYDLDGVAERFAWHYESLGRAAQMSSDLSRAAIQGAVPSRASSAASIRVGRSSRHASDTSH